MLLLEARKSQDGQRAFDDLITDTNALGEKTGMEAMELGIDTDSFLTTAVERVSK